MNKKLAILIPYRDREKHLEEFVKQALPYIKSQVHECHLYIIEQEEGKKFNRGKLFNCGYDLVKDKYDYLCFHDVDLIPEISDYSYNVIPTHLSKYCSQFNYKLLYQGLFGGVMIIPTETFGLINGFCNDYWGWGAEDDDLRDRIEHSGIKWERREGRYKSLDHKTNENDENGVAYEHVQKNRTLYSFNRTKKDFKSGLSNLKYNLIETLENENYTKYIVSV